MLLEDWEPFYAPLEHIRPGANPVPRSFSKEGLHLQVESLVEIVWRLAKDRYLLVAHLHHQLARNLVNHFSRHQSAESGIQLIDLVVNKKVAAFSTVVRRVVRRVAQACREPLPNRDSLFILASILHL